LKYFEEHDIDIVGCTMAERHPYKTPFMKAGFIAYPLRMSGYPLTKSALYCTVNLQGPSIYDKVAYQQALTLSQNPFFKEKQNWIMMSGDGDHGNISNNLIFNG